MDNTDGSGSCFAEGARLPEATERSKGWPHIIIRNGGNVLLHTKKRSIIMHNTQFLDTKKQRAEA